MCALILGTIVVVLLLLITIVVIQKFLVKFHLQMQITLLDLEIVTFNAKNKPVEHQIGFVVAAEV